MAKFLFHLLKLFATTFLIAFGIQYFSDCGLQNLEGTKYYDWHQAVDGKINSDVLVMGSSRGFVSYDATLIGTALGLKTFNLSYNAGGFDLQQRKLDIYLEKNTVPKIIIQNIDLAHFNTNEVLPDKDEIIPLAANRGIEALFNDFDSQSAYWPYIPLLKYNQRFSLLKKGILSNFKADISNNDRTILGYSPQERDFKIDYKNLERMQLEINKSVDFKEYKQKLKLITDYYKSRFPDSVKVIFVWAPENKLRLDTIYDSLRDPILEELKRIDKQHANFHFIDLSHDGISERDDCFYDTFHLNAKGSHLFSEKLVQEILHILSKK